MRKLEIKNDTGRKTRLRISLRITALLLIIFTITALVCLFSFQNALDGMASNSKKMVVESVARMVSSCHNFVARNMMYAELLRSGAADYRQIAQGLRDGAAGGGDGSSNEYLNGLLRDMIASGLLGFKLGYFAFPPTSETGNKPVVVASSDGKYISEQVPGAIAALVNGKRNYRLFENGIPELGLDGPYLVTSYRLTDDSSAESVLWYFDFKPMGKLLSGIDSFYDKESRNALMTLLLVIILSIIGLLVISFFVLGHLIKRRISDPIDELSKAAEKVIEGDMDVRLEIKKREDFSSLKHVFNQMISSISGIIAHAMGQQDKDLAHEPDADPEAKAHFKARSTILFEVIALCAAVFIAAAAFFMLSINSSMDSLVKKSKADTIDTEAKLVMSGHYFGMRMLLIQFEVSGAQRSMADTIQDLMKALSTETNSPIQNIINGIFRDIVGKHLFDYSLVYCILPEGMLTDDYVITFSSDEKYMYKKPPDEIIEFFDTDEDTYKFFRNGIPEMGLNEPYLASSLRTEALALGSKVPLVIDFRPMGEEVKKIDDFFDNERNNLMLTMVIIMGISLLVMILITLLTLAYLIRKQITGPIDELVTVASKVMDGDLDVQVNIRPGENLESLKVAFNEMIKTLRDLVERSVEG